MKSTDEAAVVLGLDLGSSSVKALRLGRRGGGGRLVRRPIATRRGRGGHVEQDAEAILRRAIEALRSAVGADASLVRGRSFGRDMSVGRDTLIGGETRLGIATQRSTVLFWDRDDGRPLTPAYSWQDLRGAPLCERIVRRGRAGGAGASGTGVGGAGAADPAALVARRTGLRLSPHYSASKLAWALAHVPGLRRKAAAGRALWGTLGSFLLFRLSGGAFYALDHANAQRTSLLDLGTLCWDPDLFVLFGLEALLDAPALPALVPTFPSAQATLAAGGLPLRLAASTGDQQGALLGLGCRRPGDLAINYGSGAFVLENVGARPVHAPGLLTTLLASWREERAETPRAAALYALEGTVNAAATAIDWARRRLRLRVHTADLDRFLGPDDGRPRRLHFLPAISGTGAPRWDPRARPRFAGSLSGATPRDLLRAVVESIAFRCAEIVRAAETHARSGPSRGKAPARSAPVLVAGGLTHSRTLLQAQADLLGRPLLVRSLPDATALGAALMARDGARRLFREARRTRLVQARAGPSRGAGRPGDQLILPRLTLDEAEERFRAWARAVYGAGRGRGGADTDPGAAGRSEGRARRGTTARS